MKNRESAFTQVINTYRRQQFGWWAPGAILFLALAANAMADGRWVSVGVNVTMSFYMLHMLIKSRADLRLRVPLR